MKKIFTFKSILIIIFFASFLLLETNAYSYPGGIAGRTRRSGTSGCGSCHSSSSAISGTISGPNTVTAGQTYTFTLTINLASGSGDYGVDIAKGRGTLGLGTSGLLKFSGIELVHANNGISYSNPKLITFSYTAPGTAGPDTLYATIDRGYSGAWAFVPNFILDVSLTGIENNGTPVSFNLSQNFPNPFNPVTKINYSIEKSGNVSLKVFDVTGNEVSSLVSGNQTAGNHSIEFNGKNLASGIYFYRLEAEGKMEVKKMTLLK